MKVSNYAVAAVLIIFFLAGPAMAGEGHGALESGGRQMDHTKEGHSDMTGHHDTMMDHMVMMRDNMQLMKAMIGIVKDLNHRPTMVQSERLTEMIKSVDKMMVKMMKMHDEMQVKDEKRAGEEMKMNPCSMMHK